MINVNSNQSFGAARLTILTKKVEKNKRVLEKNIINIDDQLAEKTLKKVFNAYQPSNGLRKIEEATARKISEITNMLTKANIDPKNLEQKWIAKINDNKFVFGNRDALDNATRTVIDFNL